MLGQCELCHCNPCECADAELVYFLTAEAQVREIRRLVRAWAQQQGHAACWYYPAVFRQIQQVLGETPPPVALPARAEFEAGCSRFQDEVFR